MVSDNSALPDPLSHTLPGQKTPKDAESWLCIGHETGNKPGIPWNFNYFLAFQLSQVGKPAVLSAEMISVPIPVSQFYLWQHSSAGTWSGTGSFLSWNPGNTRVEMSEGFPILSLLCIYPQESGKESLKSVIPSVFPMILFFPGKFKQSSKWKNFQNTEQTSFFS